MSSGWGAKVRSCGSLAEGTHALLQCKEEAANRRALIEEQKQVGLV